jgi:hypothetical protein
LLPSPRLIETIGYLSQWKPVYYSNGTQGRPPAGNREAHLIYGFKKRPPLYEFPFRNNHKINNLVKSTSFKIKS